MTEPRPGSSVRARPGGRLGARLLWGGSVALAAWLGLDVGGAVVAPALVDVRTAVVPSPTQAVVRRVAVQDGADVRAGDVLVELDGAVIELELALAEAELARVRGAVRARQIDVADQDFEVGLRLQADVDKATLAQATIAATLKQDERELLSIGALVEKNERLVKEQLAGAQDLDELRVRLAAARERVAAAQGELQTATRLKETADRRWSEWRTRTGHEDALVAPDEAAVVAQQERVKLARWRREQLVLRAPFAGRVEHVHVGEGDVVAAGAAVATLLDTAPDEAVAWVAEDAAFRVGVGDVARLRSVDGRGVEYAGVVRALGGGIVELPVRLRQVPGEPAFGRAVHIALATTPPANGAQATDAAATDALANGAAAPLAGQTLEATFVSRPTTTSSPATPSTTGTSSTGGPR
jgi:multidrug resistance efflux pump